MVEVGKENRWLSLERTASVREKGGFQLEIEKIEAQIAVEENYNQSVQTKKGWRGGNRSSLKLEAEVLTAVTEEETLLTLAGEILRSPGLTCNPVHLLSIST